MREIALGGTAVETGSQSAYRSSEENAAAPGATHRHRIYEAKNHFEAQCGKDAVVEASDHLKTIAVSLFKIANDYSLARERSALGHQRNSTSRRTIAVAKNREFAMARGISSVRASEIGRCRLTWRERISPARARSDQRCAAESASAQAPVSLTNYERLSLLQRRQDQHRARHCP